MQYNKARLQINGDFSLSKRLIDLQYLPSCQVVPRIGSLLFGLGPSSPACVWRLAGGLLWSTVSTCHESSRVVTRPHATRLENEIAKLAVWRDDEIVT